MSAALARPELAALRVADPPERWRALGFTVAGSSMALGGVEVELGVPGRGIVGWRLRGADSGPEIDGLPTESARSALEHDGGSHPNRATGLDHVVVITPDFDRTAAALEQAGMALRRVREAPGGFRQGFRRLGGVILELVEARGGERPDDSRAGRSGEAGGRAAGKREPARFWGLVVIVEDLDALARRLGERLGEIKPAVQPGRRIATLRESAGLGEAVAFISAET